MAKIELIKCDNCGKQKETSNHWWQMYANVENKSMFIYPLDKMKVTTGYMKDSDDKYTSYTRLDACGLECLGILESKIKEGVNPLK
jgi:hypothetical protein